MRESNWPFMLCCMILNVSSDDLRLSDLVGYRTRKPLSFSFFIQSLHLASSNGLVALILVLAIIKRLKQETTALPRAAGPWLNALPPFSVFSHRFSTNARKYWENCILPRVASPWQNAFLRPAPPQAATISALSDSSSDGGFSRMSLVSLWTFGSLGCWSELSAQLSPVLLQLSVRLDSPWLLDGV